MKVSLAWVCEYLNVNCTDIDVPELVSRFNKTTAEIESYYKIVTDTNLLSIGRVTHIKKDTVTVLCDEWHSEIVLPICSHIALDEWYLVKRDGDQYRWAFSSDLGAKKSMPLRAIWASDSIRNGAWKNTFQVQDWILDIDNKSITNRPDLWGHYGIAREVAAMYDYQLETFENLLAKKDIHHGQDILSNDDGFTITNEAPTSCKRFAGLYFEYIERRASLLWMATRLSRIDIRCIDAIVDMTNYVMFDISQPLHAFDVQKLSMKTIQVRMAVNKEKLELLDDQVIELTSDDLIISDGKIPIALAGIMGGRSTAVTPKTHSIFLEAACFDATMIRKTSAQFGLRSEASGRFEKSLDPNQNVDGICRFLHLVYQDDIDVKEAEAILSLGVRTEEQQVQVLHAFIEQRLGTSVSSEFLINTLRKLDFTIDESDTLYTIKIPSFRASKDIALKEDIVEEVGRFFGYENIPYVFPKRQMRPFSVAAVMRIRALKELMAYGLHMHEVQPYAFFDQSFLQRIQWEPTDVLSVQNPVSGNWKQLITSLLPSLFKSVADHATTHENLRFFEWGRVWTKKTQVIEAKSLSGIIYAQKQPLTFYTGKALVSELFAMLQMDVIWKVAKIRNKPWFDPAQTAVLMHQDNKIGIAGIVDQGFLETIAFGNAFAFELNGNYLLYFKPPVAHYRAPSKFPAVHRDISLFIPRTITVDAIANCINKVDERVTKVVLEDYFAKEEWGDRKSITMRCTIVDQTKTLTKEEVDTIMSAIEDQLTHLGGTVR
jgi:phenylalanyl-tRNA synthetase beta chain